MTDTPDRLVPETNPLSPDTDPSRARELGWEERMISSGALRYQKRILKARQKGRENETDYGLHLIRLIIKPLVEKIQQFLEEAQSKPGKRALAAVVLSKVDPEVAAYLTARTVFSTIYRSNPLQATAIRIGMEIEDELRFSTFQEKEPEHWKGTNSWMEKDTSHGWDMSKRRKILRHAATVHELGWRPWSSPERAHIGVALIDLFLSVAGDMVTLVKSPYKGRRGSGTYSLVPTQELLAWVAQTVARNELIRPMTLPMIEPPVPWEGLRGGGYYNSRLKKALVRGLKSKAWARELASRDLGIVYDAVNALQAVPWTVDTYILETAEACLQAGIEVKGLPSKDLATYPPKPQGYNPLANARHRWDRVHPGEKKAWKKKARKIFHANRKAASRLMLSSSVLSTARLMAAYQRIYFPLQLDFRGRIYPVPSGLNPQGSDLAKALLRFAGGKPLGERGAWWLKVHIANVWGYDKVSFEDRVKWVEDNTAWIIRCANDPLEHREWMGADKPWRFLQAAAELVGYQTDGDAFESSLVLDIDGSCNGIQHLAAMSCDSVAGRQVNLLPADKPADIYQDVADHLIVILKGEAEGREMLPPNKSGKPRSPRLLMTLGMGDKQMAQAWLDFGITRKLTKRPTMVQPYGGTRTSASDYVEQFLIDAAEEGRAGPWGEKTSAAAAWLMPRLWLAMEQVITGPRAVMEWLKSVARIAGSHGIPLTWEVPSGFLVQQAYPDVSHHRIKTKLGESIVQLMIVTLEETGLDSHRQRQSTAPNWIHSLDAAALMKTIVAARDRGLVMSSVHDSYGTHAADMDILAEETRKQFVALYAGRNVLENFREQIAHLLPPDSEPLPPAPPLGDLDVTQVLYSQFFFA